MYDFKGEFKAFLLKMKAELEEITKRMSKEDWSSWTGAGVSVLEEDISSSLEDVE